MDNKLQRVLKNIEKAYALKERQNKTLQRELNKILQDLTAFSCEKRAEYDKNYSTKKNAL